MESAAAVTGASSLRWPCSRNSHAMGFSRTITTLQEYPLAPSILGSTRDRGRMPVASWLNLSTFHTITSHWRFICGCELSSTSTILDSNGVTVYDWHRQHI